MGRLRALAVVGLLVVGTASPLAAREPVSTSDVLVRRRLDVAGAVTWVAQEAKTRGAGQVLWVFDAATFAPPPGLTEFTSEYAFCDDLPRWIEALGAWPADGPVLRVTSSLAPPTVGCQGDGWQARVNALVQRPWYEGDGMRKFEPAARWIPRLLGATEVVAGQRTDLPRVVVLVTGHLTPERWVPAEATEGYESEWRTRLLPVGAYWDPVEVEAALDRNRASLLVIAPEARFGDERPASELPELPWAARPTFPGSDIGGPLHRVLGGIAPGAAGRLFDAKWEAKERARLDRDYASMFRDPVERAKFIDEVLARIRDRPITPGGREPKVPVLVPPPVGGRRFLATTPVWFLRHGAVWLWANHAPSGYGQHALATTAAETGGRYLFYPFPESPWLDACPRDDGLLARLAPELVTLERYTRERTGDEAVDAMSRAAALVEGVTPWTDGFDGHHAASGFSAFARANPLKLEDDWFLRRRAADDALVDAEDGMKRLGERLRDKTLPAYDKALEVVERVLKAHAAGKPVRAHPRSLADLHLTRFHLAMSAFHLEAYSIYAREIERFVPPEMKGHVDKVVVTYVPTIRMSDCLDAYDGKELPADGEPKYPRWTPSGAVGYQGNLLVIPEDDPVYRAKRSLDRVLKHLDARLLRRAGMMIDAARAVMDRYGRTGWGWTTYYADAFTFVFKPVEVERGHRPTPGGTSPTPRPTTPQGPGSSPGGSAPGGPVSK